MSLLVLRPRLRHTSSCIWLHGLGDSGQGWLDGVNVLAAALPSTKFILPTAKAIPVTLNGGMAMPAWYNLAGGADRADEKCEGLDASIALVRSLLAEEVEGGVPIGACVVGGFSQGAALALSVGLRQPAGEALAGVVALSGYLPHIKSIGEFATPAGVSTRFRMWHGDSDPMVLPEYGTASVGALEAAGADVRMSMIPGLAHSVTIEELQECADEIKLFVPRVEEEGGEGGGGEREGKL